MVAKFKSPRRPNGTKTEGGCGLIPAKKGHSKRIIGRNRKRCWNPCASFASRHSLSLTTHHVIGHAAECVAAFATAQQPDLIMMGSHGHSATANLLLGSAAAGILARCGIPTLIVRYLRIATKPERDKTPGAATGVARTAHSIPGLGVHMLLRYEVIAVPP
ncbi:universal stress protein [Paraburkholderia strydomiana]|uniref:universal stress protein n=1 Tax=Paraburkholderia strydomiana TaxID=1245417 RepID=UPI0035B5336E